MQKRINKYIYEGYISMPNLMNELNHITLGESNDETVLKVRSLSLKSLGNFSCYIMSLKNYNEIILPTIEKYFNPSKLTIIDNYVKNKNLEFFITENYPKGYKPPPLNLLLGDDIVKPVFDNTIWVDDRVSVKLINFTMTESYKGMQLYNTNEYIAFDEESYYFICSLYDAVRLAKESL